MIEKTIAPSTDNGRGYSGNSCGLAHVGLPGTASEKRPSEKPAVRESGRTVLSKSFSAVMKIAPSNPVLLLWIASICFKLNRPRRAYEVLFTTSVSDWKTAARPRGAMEWVTKAAASMATLGYPAESEDLLRLAVAVSPELGPALLALAAMVMERARQVGSRLAASQDCRREHWTEAEHLVRQAVAADPSLSAPRLALAGLLFERLQYLEALDVAAEGVRCCPSSLDLRLVLARIQFQLRRYADAAMTIEALLAVAPAHAWAWYELGKIARNSYERLGIADTAFRRAADFAEKNAALLAAVAENFLYDLNFATAAECYERLLQVEPAMRANFLVCRKYATCLNACGRTVEAAEMIAAGLESSRTLAAMSKDDAWQVLKREESLLLREAHRFQEADAALRSIGEASDGRPPCYDRPEYLPDTPRRLQRLSEIIGSRDLLVMAQGPSFAQFAERMEEFAQFDFAIVTLNSFPPIEYELSKRLGRTADLLLLTHSGSIQSWGDELEAFLDRPSQNLVAITRYALSALPELGINEDQFLSRHGDRLLLVTADGGPPLPARPLHFESGSTLSLLIPLLLFGRPRRIFLFGADGGATPDHCKRPYFFYHDFDSLLPPEPFLSRRDMISFAGRSEQLQVANRRFYINAVNGDRIMAEAFRTLNIVFGISTPPIFNVCPHSSHKMFRRINIETALEELATAGRSEPHHTQHCLTKFVGAAADSRAILVH